jgi:hypothetical protein
MNNDCEVANKSVVEASKHLDYARSLLENASMNLTYRSFAADVVEECNRMLYVIKSKLETVEKITEKVYS